jgi:hypothetical protein
MDVAVFVSSRRRMWAWLTVPVVLTVAVHISVRAYVAQATRTLRQRSEMAMELPQMEERLKAVRAALEKFALPRREDLDTAELLKSRVSETARQSGFSIDSLSVEQPTDASALARGAIPFMTMRIEGQSPLAGVVRLVNEMQTTGGLVAVDAASLKIMGLVTSPSYNTELTLRCYLITI